MSSDKKKQDIDYFRQAMSGIRPIKDPDRIDPITSGVKPVPRQQRRDDEAVLDELLEYDRLAPAPESGEDFAWHKPGVQKRTLKRLRSGHYSVLDSIDLHHMSEKTARKVLLDFLDHAHRQGFGCVRVIHGKGLRSANRPTLKLMTANLLRKHPKVICYASCRPVDGGSGATNVLLSARKRP